MRLTDTQRRQIQRGTYPFLALEEDEAKVLEAHEIKITEQLVVTVVGARKDKKAGWYAEYTVRDDRPRFMRRGQGYTHSLALAVANEDTEAVPPEYQKELTMMARQRHLSTVETERAEELARRQFKSFADAARGLCVKRAKMGLPPPDLVRMLREFEVNEEEAA
jgi:hypothetical protein